VCDSSAKKPAKEDIDPQDQLSPIQPDPAPKPSNAVHEYAVIELPPGPAPPHKQPTQP
jgi:hypothetical protein